MVFKVPCGCTETGFPFNLFNRTIAVLCFVLAASAGREQYLNPEIFLGLLPSTTLYLLLLHLYGLDLYLQ